MDHRRLVALILLLGVAQAQTAGPVYVYSGTPSGACSTSRTLFTTTGIFYCCSGGTWAACGTAVAVPWTGVSGKPSTFTPSTHTHGDADLTSIDWSEVLNKPGTFTPATHTHAGGDVTSAVSTASALASDPTDCTTPSFARGINASGIAQCAQPTYSEISGTPSIPADISGAPFVTTAASGLLSAESVLPTCGGTTKLTFNGTTISCATDQDTIYSLPDATAGVTGGIRLTTDLGGTATAPTVVDDSHAHTSTTISGLDASNDFSAGTLPAARGGLGQAQPTCAGTDKLTCNGTTCSCATDQTGGAGSSNFAEVDVNFTAAGKDMVSTVVTGQTWVTATSKIICTPTLLATSTRSEGDEDAVIEDLVAAVHTRVVGTGFTLTVVPAVGDASGTFKFHCTGG